MAQDIPTGAVAYSMVRIGMSHITAGDDALLARLADDRTEGGGTDVHVWREAALGADAGYAVPMEGGWLLRVQEDGEDEDREVLAAGFSGAFVGLLAFWRERAVAWLRLDRDACAVAGLPVFER